MHFSRIFPRVFTRFLLWIIVTKFTVMKAFCYIPSFRFLRIYLICRFWCNDIHFSNTSRAYTRSIFSYFPGEFFTVVPKIVVEEIDTIPLPSIFTLFSIRRLSKQTPTIEGTVEITETKIFLLNRAGKLHRLSPNKRIAKYRASEIVLVSDRKLHRIPLALSRKKSLWIVPFVICADIFSLAALSEEECAGTASCCNRKSRQ